MLSYQLIKDRQNALENDKLIYYKSNLWPCHTLQMIDQDQNDKKMVESLCMQPLTLIFVTVIV